MRTKIKQLFNILAVFLCVFAYDTWAKDVTKTWQEIYYLNRYNNPIQAIESLQAQYNLTDDISEKLYLKELIYKLYIDNNQPYKNHNTAFDLEKKYISALIASNNANHSKAINILSELLNDAIVKNDIKQQELFNYQLCKVINNFGQYTISEHYCNTLLSMFDDDSYNPWCLLLFAITI